jgi:phenylacetate-CoA ligase
MNRNLILDASSITEETMARFADSLKRFRPKVVLAYANVAALFARFLLDNSIEIPRPDSVISSAEMLVDEDKRLIEEAFGCKVYNRYGCREFAVIASECGQGRGMHIAAETFYVEFVADGKHATSEQFGKILITDLMNYAMPLIRYEIGDVGTPLEGPCACGRGLPLMEISGGRVTDFILSTRGELVSGVALATYAITNIDGIARVQVLQERPESVSVKLVKGPAYSPSSEEELIKRFKAFLGEDMNVKIAPVSEIPPTSSGKNLFSISTVARDRF